MKFSIKITLGVVAFAGLCSIYYLDDYFSKQKEAKKEELEKAIYFKTEDVLNLSLKSSKGQYVFSREKNTSDWKMIEPKNISADQDTVNSVLSSLSQISVQQEIDDTKGYINKDKTYLNQFGLDNPMFLATVTLSGKKTQTLQVGSGLNIGGKNVKLDDPISRYGINPDRDKILVLDAANISALDKKSFSDFRTKRVASFSTHNVTKIQISSKSTNVTLEKINNIWKLTSPEEARGDDIFISSYLNTFQTLFAQSVIEKEVVQEKGRLVYDLDVPAANIRFADSAGKMIQEFALGITKDAVYIQMSDGAVGKLNLSAWTDYVPKASKFRNRQVMNGVDVSKISAIKLDSSFFYVKKDRDWFKLAGVDAVLRPEDKPNVAMSSFFSSFGYMSAEDVEPSPTSAELSRFGLANPIKKFSFIFAKDTNLSPIEISIGNRVPRNEKSVYIKRSDLPTVFVVSADWLNQLAVLAENKKT